MLDADRWAGPGRRAGNWVLTCCLRRRQRPVAGWAWLFVRRAAHRGLDGKAPWQGTKSECDHWPWALGLGPWNIDRLRRPDNGGGNGVCASRRYVLLDRQAARAGGRAHLSLPVPGEPCLPASGTLQNDLPGLLVDSVRAMLSAKEARSSSCGRATCLLSIVGSAHPHVQTSLAAKRICASLLILDPALSRSVEEQDGCSQTVAAHLRGQCRRVPGLRRGGSVGAVGSLSGMSDSGTCTV